MQYELYRETRQKTRCYKPFVALSGLEGGGSDTSDTVEVSGMEIDNVAGLWGFIGSGGGDTDASSGSRLGVTSENRSSL